MNIIKESTQTLRTNRWCETTYNKHVTLYSNFWDIFSGGLPMKRKSFAFEDSKIMLKLLYLDFYREIGKAKFLGFKTFFF